MKMSALSGLIGKIKKAVGLSHQTLIEKQHMGRLVDQKVVQQVIIKIFILFHVGYFLKHLM